MRKIVHRLSSKVAFYLAGISLLVTFIMTALQIAYEYQHEISILHSQVTAFHNKFAQQIYEHQQNGANDLLITDENILSIDLVSLNSTSKKNIYHSSSFTNNQILKHDQMNLKLSNSNENHLQYTISLHIVFEKIKSIFWSTLFLHALRSFLIAIFLYILIDQSIIHRLQFIENHINSFHMNKRLNQQHLKVPKFGKQEDEIDNLFETIQKLFIRINEQHQTLAKELNEKKEVQNQLFQTSMQIATQQTTSGMFHDLNNLLMICLGATELLKLKGDEKLQPTIQKIDKSLNLAIDLIRAQQQSSKKVDKPDLYIVEKIINDAYILEERSLKRDGIELTIRVEQEIESFMPKSLIILVLLNLLKNAREAIKDAQIEKGQIIVHATIDHNYWKISVIDNGPGVKKEFQSKLFSFGETTKTDGHGFGISHCRQALELNQGGLKYEPMNPFLSGACFTLWLPYLPMDISKAS